MTSRVVVSGEIASWSRDNLAGTVKVVVRDVARSIRFYCDVLDFELDKHVPEQAPFVFASVRGGGIEIFLKDWAKVPK